jgi:hypothetical protein
LPTNFLSEHLKGVDYRKNIRTYLRDAGSGMSTEFIWLSTEGNTVPATAMLSVRDTELLHRKVLPEFEQCSCSVPLVLSHTVLFLRNRVADIRLRSCGVIS